MNPITPAELAAYFDHTQLRAYAQRGDFEKLCACLLYTSPSPRDS